jgi:hypothetical protein
MAVRRVGYSWPKTVWAGVIVWGLCLIVMTAALRITEGLGVDADPWIGVIGALAIGGWITWRISRPD